MSGLRRRFTSFMGDTSLRADIRLEREATIPRTGHDRYLRVPKSNIRPKQTHV